MVKVSRDWGRLDTEVEEISVGKRVVGCRALNREILSIVVETVVRNGILKISRRGMLEGCWDSGRGGK